MSASEIKVKVESMIADIPHHADDTGRMVSEETSQQGVLDSLVMVRDFVEARAVSDGKMDSMQLLIDATLAACDGLEAVCEQLSSGSLTVGDFYDIEKDVENIESGLRDTIIKVSKKEDSHA